MAHPKEQPHFVKSSTTRQDKREEARGSKKHGDLNRKLKHKMRSNMGMR